MTKAEHERFVALRKKVMAAIKRELEIDFYCKSYEGTFELTVCYPNYFDDSEGVLAPNYYVLTLHCYVLGPGRHYDWRGNTIEKVLDDAEREIGSWVVEDNA